MIWAGRLAIAIVGALLVQGASATSDRLLRQVSGRVVVVDEGIESPLGGAVVSLNREGAADLVVRADFAGAFSFADVPSGIVFVHATKSPYVSAEPDAHFTGGFRAIDTDAASSSGLVLRMRRGAVIEGILRDAYDRPMNGVHVSLVRAVPLNGSNTVGRVERSAITDDLGTFRFFGLTRARYLIAAQQRTGGAPLEAVEAGPKGDRPLPVAYAPTWFPGMTDSSAASSIVVEAGENRIGMDFVMRLVPSNRIAGVVLDDVGRPLTGGTVRLASVAPEVPPGTLRTMVLSPTGAFEVRGLVPSTYRLIVQSGDLRVARDVMLSADVDGLELRLSPGLHVTGRLTRRGGAAIARARVILTAAQPGISIGGARTAEGVSAADGTFDVKGLFPGTYYVDVLLSPAVQTEQIRLLSAVTDDQDVLDRGLQVRSGVDTHMALVADVGGSELFGTVVAANGSPAVGYSVLVMPTDKTLWRPGSRRVQMTRAGSNGSYRIPGLPGGDYYAAAVIARDLKSAWDDFDLEAVGRLGLIVTIGTDMTKRLDVRLLR